MKKLLSVDWDYFFPNKVVDEDEWYLWAWDHSERYHPLVLESLWEGRAWHFLKNGIELPGTSGEEKTFWSRFRIHPRATLFVAESHVRALSGRVKRDVDEIWNYDAHHDCGYDGPDSLQVFARKDSVTCEDWMIMYMVWGAQLHVRYPRWAEDYVESQEKPGIDVDAKLDDDTVLPVIDRLFLCRSGSWVPPWLDDQFEQFVESAPVRRVVRIQEIANRKFSMADVHRRFAVDLTYLLQKIVERRGRT